MRDDVIDGMVDTTTGGDEKFGMDRFPTIAHKLKTVFNVNHGLSEDVAIRLYKQTASSPNGELLKRELREAFADAQFSWRQMLRNPEYEVLDADTEEEARAYARRILWGPLFDGFDERGS